MLAAKSFKKMSLVNLSMSLFRVSPAEMLYFLTLIKFRIKILQTVDTKTEFTGQWTYLGSCLQGHTPSEMGE